MNYLAAIFIIVLMVFDASAKKFSDNDLTIGDKTTSVKTITLGKSGQNIIRVPSGGGNLEISNNGGSSFDEVSAGEQPNEPNTVSNGAILTSVASSALTVNLKQSDASTDATAADPVRVSMRVTPLTSGAYNSRTVTSSLSLVVPSGATLNHTSGNDGFIYVYLLDNSGTLELAVSSSKKDESVLQTTIALSTGSDAAALYSTTLRSNVPIQLIARLKSNQVTAGTWALNMAEIFPGYDLTGSLINKWARPATAQVGDHVHAVARLTCSAGSTIDDQQDSWISSIGNVSAGACIITFITNTFSAIPICHVTSTGLANPNVGYSLNSPAAGAMTVDCDSFAGADCPTTSFHFSCSGIK